MEIFTDFVENYKGSLQGLNIFAKIGVTLALALILLAVVGAIINVIVLNV
ncbi:hypothetical protein [Christiangramia forsetii]|uniref:Uncharacterized protein n=2 Tax=Christiangramia forsetii TaxID=411153 RepID=A0M5N9_CHRFK|nr:hypothetical protein [Christiangramia forsetii]GGG32530.1 hypothetical protein GCM10011532_15100 [Christiangramia forsetii]CAL67934.1 hypothetical protein GFO_2988 [Christiangramia forsetii KT0803]